MAIDPNVFHNMTDATLQNVALANSQDGNLKTLRDMISYGWPKYRLMSVIIGHIEMNWQFRME